MLLHELKPNHPLKSKKPRVGHGGKRGYSSGRGQKGQKSRAGHRIRPAERDLIIRIPKLRGYQNKPLKKAAVAVRVGLLEKVSGDIVTLETLVGARIVRRSVGRVKILDGGDLKRKMTVKGLEISAGARKKIEAAGGKVE